MFTLLSMMATFCMQSCLWANISSNNGKTRVGVGGTGLCNWGNAAWSMKTEPLNGYSLTEACFPVLLTWRFVAVMNILPRIVEASLGCSVFSCSSAHGRLRDTGWLAFFLFCCSITLMKFIACVKRGFIERWLRFIICSWSTAEINLPPEKSF